MNVHDVDRYIFQSGKRYGKSTLIELMKEAYEKIKNHPVRHGNVRLENNEFLQRKINKRRK